MAVKPDVVPKVLRELSTRVTGHHLVISIAAGVTLQSLQHVRGVSLVLGRVSKGCEGSSFVAALSLESACIPPTPNNQRPLLAPTDEQQLPDGARVVRVMPNTPCLVGESAAAFALGENCLPEDAATVKRIFSSVGLAVEVKEKDLNGACGLRVV